MKLLVFADVHINDYPTLNRSHHERLLQSLKVAERIVEVAKEHNVKYLIGAGDYAERATHRPYVNHVVKQFFKILSVYPGYYILGQHDMDTTTIQTEMDDSNIHLLVPDNWTYANGMRFRVDNDKLIQDPEGTDILMLDYRRKWTEKIEGHYKLIISHLTIENSDFFGQSFDGTIADKIIHGDIHISRQIKNFISIGTPVQGKMGDQPESKVVIYDTDTGSHEWIDLDPDNSRFIKAIYTEDKSDAGWHGNVYHKFKKSKVKKTQKNSEEVLNYLDVDELIHKILKRENLLDIHKLVSERTNYTRSSFDFKFRKLIIKNFRSIEKMTLEFRDGDKILIQGVNGSGKSSLVGAIDHLFNYDKDWKDDISHWSDSMTVTGIFEYGKDVIEVTRGTKNKLVINGVTHKFPNSKTFHEEVSKRIPFFKYPDLYFHSGTKGGLKNYSEVRRSELILKMTGIDYLLKYSSTSKKLIEELTNEIKSLNTELKVLNKTRKDLIESRNKYGEVEQLSSLESSLTLIKSRIENTKRRDEINVRISELDQLIDTCQRLITPHEIIEQKESDLNEMRKSYLEKKSVYDAYDKLISRRSSMEGDILKVNESILKLKESHCPTCNSVLDSDKINKLRTKYELEVKSLEESINQLNITEPDFPRDELQQLVTRGQELSAELKVMKQYDSNGTKELLESYIGTRDQLSEELKSLTEVSPDDKDDERLRDIESKILISQKVELLESQIKDTDSKISEIDQNRITEVMTQIKRVEKYQDLTSNTGEILETVLKYLAEYYSNDEFSYKVRSYELRGVHHLGISMQMKVGEKFITFSRLSTGQSVISGLHFLSNIIDHTGLIVFDEYVGSLDQNNMARANTMISDLESNLILNINHSDNNIAMNRMIVLGLDEQGRTQILEDSPL